MKKYLSVLLTLIAAVCCICACGNKNSVNSEIASDNEKNIKVVTTIFPEYDWVRQIAGDKSSDIELTMLLDNGIDLHNYQPTADDILKISSCDIFIYVGGESDNWVSNVLKEASNKNMQVINLLDILGDNAKEEEIVEGMQAEEEEASEDEEEGPEYDEHVWLSLNNAKIFCRYIADALGKADVENKNIYDTNAETYINKLDDLDKRYQETVKNAACKTLVFGDRFPFRYLVDDYGLDYYAAFVGCSAESEASFETILFLSGKIDELGIKNVMTIEKSDKKIARTVVDNTKNKNQDILTLDSMQSVTSGDVAKGITYISIMEENLSILKEALQ